MTKKAFSLRGTSPRRTKKEGGGNIDDPISQEQFVNEAETEVQKDEVEPSSNEIKEIPTDKIISNDYNAREFYCPEKIKTLALEIANDRQIVPAIVIKNGDGYKLIDGHYRLMAIKSLNRATLRCEVYPNELTGIKLFEISHFANKSRNQQTVLDHAVVWARLIEKDGITQKKLSEVLGCSTAEVSKTISVSSLPMHFLEKLSKKKTPLSLKSAYNISLVFNTTGDNEKFYSLIQKVIEGDLTGVEVESLKNRILMARKVVKKKNPHYEIKNSQGKKIGYMDTEKNKIKMQFNAQTSEAAKLIMEEVAKILENHCE